jgi:hypothetical protein
MIFKLEPDYYYLTVRLAKVALNTQATLMRIAHHATFVR